MAKLYFREQKSGIAVELWNDMFNEKKDKLSLKVYDDTMCIYMSPNRARNLEKLLHKALEKMPVKAEYFEEQ